MASTKSNTSKSETPQDKFSTVLEFPDARTAGEFLRAHPLDHVTTEAITGRKTIRLTFYLTTPEIEALRKEGLTPDVGENMSERGRQRQKEVGKGDRFEGGKLAPTPRGLKVEGK
jgi:hypothetical protein